MIASFSSSSRFSRLLLRLFAQNLEVGLYRVHADHVIVLGQIHAVHAAGLAAHGAHFRLAEQDGLAVMAGQENHLLAVGQLDADQFVIAIQIDGDDARGTRIAELGERGLLHRAVARREENKAAGLFEVARGHQRRQVLVLLELHQAADGFAARGRSRLRNLVNLEPVDAPLRAEQQNVAVRGGDEEMLDEVLFARARADAALAAARLVAIDVHRRALDVARHG